MAIFCMLLGASLAIAAEAPNLPPQDWPMFGGNVEGTSANPAPSGISAANVGRLSHRQIKLAGTVDASAIYLHDVTVHGALRNAIFLTTTYGKTLALDAASGEVLWVYTPSAYRQLAGTRQITTSTPVADPDRQYLYAASPDGFIQKLAVGDGRPLWRTSVTKLPGREKLASPLKLFRGRVIAVTAGYVGDRAPYQGHVAILDGTSGTLLHVWNSLCSNRTGLLEPASCPQSRSAIWGRAGAVIDPVNGDILIATGNGNWNGTTDWGDSLIELDADATEMRGSYTPADTSTLNARDLDLGSSSPVLLGGDSIVQGGKDGKLRLLSRRAIGGVRPHMDHELQTVSTPSGSDLFSQPAVWEHDGRPWLFAADNGGTAAWELEGDRLVEKWQTSTGGTSPFLADGLLFGYSGRGALNVYEAVSGKPVAALSCGPGHWNSPIVLQGEIILPEGSANDHSDSGVLDIWSLPDAPAPPS